MKTLYTKISCYALGLLALMFTSCNDADYKELNEGLYLAETNTNSLVVKKVTSAEDGSYTLTVTPRLVGPIEQDVNVQIGIDHNALSAYNERNGIELVAVPDEYIELTEANTTIKAGEVLAPTVTVTVKKLSNDLLNSGKKLAVPLGIVDGGGQQLITDASVLIYRLEQLPIVTVPVVNSSNNLKFNMRQDYALTQWTVEFCVNMDKLGTSIGEYNNQAMFAASAPDGMDGEIYTRFGDAPIKGNIFQVKNQGSQMNSNTEFSMDKWYHIALVCDASYIYMYINGELDNQLAVTGKVTNLSKDKFNFGNTSYLVANAMVSEVRFWTKALSQVQIKENMYSVDPASDGLEAYWRLNEGKGNEFKDCTGHGNDGVSLGTTVWKENQRLDGKQ